MNFSIKNNSNRFIVFSVFQNTIGNINKIPSLNLKYFYAGSWPKEKELKEAFTC